MGDRHLAALPGRNAGTGCPARSRRCGTSRGRSRSASITPAVGNDDSNAKARKSLFFKPTGGHGGKAVYRGDKVTKGVWAEIARGGYVAQNLVRPSEHMIAIDDALQARKMDVRLPTYDGQVLLVAARLYQGQTTNFRTPGLEHHYSEAGVRPRVQASMGLHCGEPRLRMLLVPPSWQKICVHPKTCFRKNQQLSAPLHTRIIRTGDLSESVGLLSGLSQADIGYVAQLRSVWRP